MSTRINTNITALNALRSQESVRNSLSVSELRLATGKRINQAADDAAGLSIAKKLNVRSKSLSQSISNIGNAKNLMSVAEGHLNNILDIVTRIKQKATQGADDSLGTAERNAINAEIKKLTEQIDAEVNSAEWNGQNLLNGTKTAGDSSSALNLQIVAESSSDNIMKFDMFNSNNVSFATGNTGFSVSSLGLGSGLDLSKTFIEAGFENTILDGMAVLDEIIPSRRNPYNANRTANQYKVGWTK
ncbi:MAG: hypothetical protein FJ264_11205 [Planctomycetes bacterium]|nr:hypothetical protein [Planctomycetota bacterium]